MTAKRIPRWVSALGAFLVVAACASLGLAGTDEPESAALEVSGQTPDLGRQQPARHAYGWVPEQSSLSPEAALEQRLAALAREIERRLAESPDAQPQPEFEAAGLSAEIQEILARAEDKAAVSVHVRDLETQRVLFDSIGNTPLIPASNQKLLTSAAALDLLGAEYRFDTHLYLDGNTLYLMGTGDPTLDTDGLHAIAVELLERVDMASIDKLVIDDSAFSPRRFGPGYATDGAGLAYQAPSGALSLNFNTVEVTVFAEKGERRPTVRLVPQSSHFVVKNLAWAGRRGGIAIRTRAGDQTTIVEIQGSRSRRQRKVQERRRVDDPGLFTGGAFAHMLAELTASEPVPVERGLVPTGADLVLATESAPLIEVLDSGLAYSNNFIAEQVLRTVAWRMTGDPGDWSTGVEILHDYWAALGNDPDALVVENASGLSRQGRLTTAGLVDLVSVAYRAAQENGGLIGALPVAGEAGTLRSRLRRSGKRVRAKTGTLDGVSGLTGVITSEEGKPQVAFSILTNVREGVSMNAAARRRLEDRVVMAVLTALDDFETDRGLLR